MLLCEQGRRNLHVTDAPLIARGRETGDVADHAAPQGQHRGIAIHFIADQRVEHPRGGLQSLVLLAVRQDALGDPSSGKTVPQFRQVQLRHGRIGHDQEVPPANAGLQQLAVRQQSRADRDRIARMPDVYVKRLHCVDYTNHFALVPGNSPRGGSLPP